MSEDTQERRRCKRYTIKGCTIQYKPVGFLNFFSKTSKKYLVLTISQNGLQFITRESIREKTILLLDITAPVLNGEIIHAKGRVIWTKASPGLHICAIGVEFIALEETDRNRLQLLLDNATVDKELK